MKVLSVHNYYRYPGGEDGVFEAEAALLEARGHEVLRFTDRNSRISRLHPGLAAARTIWSTATFGEMSRIVRRERPEVVHFHNTFPLISPSAYYAVRHNGTAIVQTLHNYRLICPNAQLFRQGRVCESCVGRTVAWPGVLHACYHHGRAATGVVATMLAVHKALGTWEEKPDLYVALSEFARRKFIAGGLPAERIVVKPNFVAHDPGPGDGEGEYALFVGRLSAEKGVHVLLDAWSRLGGRVPLVAIGDGPLSSYMAEAQARRPEIRWLGWCSRQEVQARMRGARFLVLPSVWHEPFGLALTEAFAAGRPAVVSDIGAPGEIVEDGRTGWTFPPGDAAALAERAERLWLDPGRAAAMGRAARQEFEAHYTAERGYERLMEVYAMARERVAR